MHGGDIYNNRVDLDHSVNLNPYFDSGDSEDSLYPDIDQTSLRKVIAASEGVCQENVFAGCGASELLMAAALAVKPVCALTVEPCFTGYAHVLAAIDGCERKKYFLREEDGFALTGDVFNALTGDVDAFFLADPNNPTGQNIDEDLLIRILDRTKEQGIAVILDESFYPLSGGYKSGRSARLIRDYENLIIVKSYTKSFALPGIRMGCAVSTASNVEKIRKHLPEWNLPARSEKVMEECVKKWDDDLYEKSMKLIETERAFLTRELGQLGFTVFASDTNYILIKGSEGLYERLLEKHVLIRKCEDFEGLENGYYRIAVRRHEDNAKLIEAIGSVCSQ